MRWRRANPSPRGSARWVRLVGGLLGAALLSFAWAAASPVGSSPDEMDHIQYAYGIASGQALPWNMVYEFDDGEGGDGRPYTYVRLPVALLDFPSTSCSAGDPTKPAGCDSVADIRQARGQVDDEGMTDGRTHMTAYPFAYYAFAGSVMQVGLAVGLDGPDTLLLTRTLSGVLSMSVLGAAALILARRFGSSATWLALVVGVTPMALYLFTSINPNGLEIAAAALLAACLVAVRHDTARHGRPGVRIQVALVLALTLLLGCRPLSVAWASCLALLLLPRVPGGGRPILRLRRSVTALLVGLLTIGVAWMLWTDHVRQSANLGSETWDAYPIILRSGVILVRFGEMVRQAVGHFGWLDTPLPTAAWLAWIVVAVLVMAIAIGRRRLRATTSPRIAVAFLALGAGVVFVQSMIDAFGWQGRYFLPVLTAFAVLLVPAVAAGTAGLPRGWWEPVTCVGLLSINLLSLIFVLWRYVYGFQTTYTRFASVPLPIGEPGWAPAGGEVLLLLAGGVGAVLVATAILWDLRSGPAAADDVPVLPEGTPAQAATVRE